MIYDILCMMATLMMIYTMSTCQSSSAQLVGTSMAAVLSFPPDLQDLAPLPGFPTINPSVAVRLSQRLGTGTATGQMGSNLVKPGQFASTCFNLFQLVSFSLFFGDVETCIITCSWTTNWLQISLSLGRAETPPRRGRTTAGERRACAQH